MRCKKCGTELDEATKFCPNCGAKAASTNSLFSSFKELGDEFSGLGKEVASSFISKIRDSNSVKSYDIENDYVEYKYELEEDEIIVLTCNSAGIRGSLECDTDTLLLTNKRIVIEYSTGFFDNKFHIDKFDLKDIKKHNGSLQIKPVNCEDELALEIFFVDSSLVIKFYGATSKKKRIAYIDKWIKTINDIINGSDSNGNNKEVFIEDDLTKIATVVENKTVKSDVVADSEIANNRRQQFCEVCGAKIEDGLKFCTECGSPIELQDLIDVFEKQHIEEKLVQADRNFSVDQQIELLQKLKELVDMGVLSQEEFEKKKKEIL